MDKERSEKQKRVQALLNRPDTFHEVIALLLELRADVFHQITQMPMRICKTRRRLCCR